VRRSWAAGVALVTPNWARVSDPQLPLRRGGRFDRRARSAIANRRVFPYLALMTAMLGVGIGVLMRLIDKKDFHSYGDGVWWAIVTLATVGYGDIVPTTTWGRFLGSIVIIIGVTFLSFLTATVTSLFVSTSQEEKDAERETRRIADREQVLDALRTIDERLTAIESKLE
jgi:voltage-gated potassium channel